MRRLLVILVLLVLAGGGAWAFQVRPWEARANEQTFRTVRAERGDVVSAVNATGTITPTSTVIVGSQLSGQVVQIMVDHNDEVTQGMILARLSADQISARADGARADLAQARAQIAVIDAQIEKNLADIQRASTAILDTRAAAQRAATLLDDAEQTFSRQADLARRGVATEVALQQARTQLSSLKSALESSRAQADASVAAHRSLMADTGVLKGQREAAEAAVMQRAAVIRQIEVDLRNSEIRSPVDGVIVQRSIELGQTVAASLAAPTLFLVAQDLRHMEIYANVDETDVGRVRPDQVVTFQVNAYPNRTFQGRVKLVRLGSQTVSNVVIYTAVITIENPNLELKPGMTANLRVLTDRRQGVVRISNAALRYRPAGEGAQSGAGAPGAGPGGAGTLFGGGGAPAFLPGGVAGQAAGQGTRMLQDLVDAVRSEARTTAAQNTRIEEIVTQTRGEIRQAFQTAGNPQQRRETMRTLLGRLNDQIAAVMTEQQKPAFEAVRARFAEGARPGQPGQVGRVFIIGEDGKAEARRVRLGITDGQFTEVIEGLEPQQEIVVGVQSRPAARTGFLGFGS
jgi:HlyD family secretion protein